MWVPKRPGFSEFVNVNEYNEVEGGFSIAIFCYALHLLPYNVQPIFKPFINDKGEMNGTYDQLLRHIEGKVYIFLNICLAIYIVVTYVYIFHGLDIVAFHVQLSLYCFVSSLGR